MKRIDQRITDLAAAKQFAIRPPEWSRCAGGVAVRLPNWLGDTVMALPALQQLRQLLSEHAIPLYLITGGASTALADALPPGFFKRRIALESIHAPWSKRDFERVRALQVRHGILLTNSLRDTVNMRRAGIGRLYGARARMRSVLLSRSFAFPPRHRHKLNAPHHALKYLGMVYAWGAPEWDGHFPELTPRIPLEQITPEFAALCDHPNLLLLAAGAAYGAGKRWPSEHYREVAAWQAGRGGLTAVLGGANEKNIGDEITAGLPGHKVFNLCGQTNFSELLYLIQASKAMVANDSGLMHLAAAMDRPGVAVFGPTDYVATGPVSDRWTLVTDPAGCSPCFRRECRSGLHCICRVAPRQVIEVLESRGL